MSAHWIFGVGVVLWVASLILMDQLPEHRHKWMLTAVAGLAIWGWALTLFDLRAWYPLFITMGTTSCLMGPIIVWDKWRQDNHVFSTVASIPFALFAMAGGWVMQVITIVSLLRPS